MNEFDVFEWVFKLNYVCKLCIGDWNALDLNCMKIRVWQLGFGSQKCENWSNSVFDLVLR